MASSDSENSNIVTQIINPIQLPNPSLRKAKSETLSKSPTVDKKSKYSKSESKIDKKKKSEVISN